MEIEATHSELWPENLLKNVNLEIQARGGAMEAVLDHFL
jgi:hypothetical protein